MNIIAIETTGPICSVALADKMRGVFSSIKNEGRYSHLEELVPLMETILKREDLTAGDIDAVAVSCGPGSFTGIRIGLAAAKAFAQALRIEIAEVETLSSFAFTGEENTPLICPMLDARRNQVYAGAYRIEGGILKKIVPSGAYGATEFLSMAASCCSEPQVFSGDESQGDSGRALRPVLCGDWVEKNLVDRGAGAFKESGVLERLGISEKFDIASADFMHQSAENVARAALSFVEEGRLTSPFEAKAIYLRASEAERNKKTKKESSGDGRI